MNKYFDSPKVITVSIIIFTTYALLFPSISSALTLKEGLEIVTSQSRDIMISQIEENAALAQLSQTQSLYYPKLDIYGSYTVQAYQPKGKYNLALMGFGKGFMNLPMQNQDYYAYGVSLNQIVYDFGHTTHSVNAARYNANSNSLNIKVIKNTIALAYILGYYDLLYAERIIALTQMQVKNLEAHLKDTIELNKEGMNTKNDVLKVEVVLSDTRQTLLNAENNRSLTVSRLNKLLSKQLNNNLSIEDSTIEPEINFTLEKAWETAENERDELKTMSEKIKAKQEELLASNSDYYPNIFVTAGYQRIQSDYVAREDNWTALIGIKMNLFSGGSTKYQSQKINEELRELKLKNENTLQDIKLQVQEAFLARKLAAQKLEVSNTTVDQAKENLRIQELRFKEGIGTSTDVLDAITLLNKAETNYWNSVYEIKTSLTRFVYSIGMDIVSTYNK
ncbi:MAG: TolC family protein [Nitrospirae bacterium]|nr:TolC family protein [Nitrospirota bacterium]